MGLSKTVKMLAIRKEYSFPYGQLNIDLTLSSTLVIFEVNGCYIGFGDTILSMNRAFYYTAKLALAGKEVDATFYYLDVDGNIKKKTNYIYTAENFGAGA